MIYSFNYFTGGIDEQSYKGSEQCDGHGGGWRLQPWDFKNQNPKPLSKPEPEPKKEVPSIRKENPSWFNAPYEVKWITITTES